MQQADIELELIKIMRAELDNDRVAPLSNTELNDIPGWNSITMSSVMLGIEEKFGFEFRGDEIDLLSDFKSLVAVTRTKLC